MRKLYPARHVPCGVDPCGGKHIAVRRNGGGGEPQPFQPYVFDVGASAGGGYDGASFGAPLLPCAFIESVLPAHLFHAGGGHDVHSPLLQCGRELYGEFPAEKGKDSVGIFQHRHATARIRKIAREFHAYHPAAHDNDVPLGQRGGKRVVRAQRVFAAAHVESGGT